jgi:heptaprenyl diphosphate synthase
MIARKSEINMTEVQKAVLASNEQVNTILKAPVPGLSEMTSYLSQSTGKGIRALLLLTSAMDSNGRVPEDASSAAAAIELLHMATLIHDDVMDDADLRRGMLTLHKKFDTKSAIICGDYLLSQSMLMIANMGIKGTEETEDRNLLVSRFSRALAAVCRGEYMQHINASNIDINLLTYVKIISGKTAELFAISAYAGAIIAGESAPLEFRRFGRYLGMAFQIVDDCKDYELTEEQAKKPVGNDIKSGVITLPLILSMRKNPKLREIVKEVFLAQKHADEIVASVRGLDGCGEARNIANRYFELASNSLKSVLPKKQEAMLELLKIM